jgi:hypothetical protein
MLGDFFLVLIQENIKLYFKFKLSLQRSLFGNRGIDYSKMSKIQKILW